MTVCAETLAPGLAAYQELTDAGKFCDLANFDNNLAVICRGATGVARNLALQAADQRMLCAVYCCCNVNPVPSASGQGGRDTCASQTIAAAEGMMGHDSRFKSQVSFNMRTNPPSPVMQRGLFGGATTEQLPWGRHAQNRIAQELGRPYEPYDARRPDIVIVNDPSRPPTLDNINRVVDFDFAHSLDERQLEAYTILGNQAPLVLDSGTCDCSNDEETRAQTALVTAAQSVVENQRSTLARIGWGALGTVAALGAVALAFVPFDGPLGEAAAGTGAAAAFARAFAAAGWTAARSQAAAALAAQRWATIYAGAL